MESVTILLCGGAGDCAKAENTSGIASKDKISFFITRNFKMMYGSLQISD
jgi:hypothetical protein